jgi:NAD(P)-dependent dehydrogenase (short-subunit alcohol dehydrogenase family)
MEIKGQSALVTGGASGLGAASAVALAAAGARVAVLDLNEGLGRQVADDIGGVFVPCDVADGEGAEAAIETAAADQGEARILVHCAGIGIASRIVGREGPGSLEAYERTIKINLTGTFNMMRLAAHRMSLTQPLETGERGVIITTASVAAFDGQIGQAAYSASKGGVAAMTLPAARELARFGVRVMTIAPGILKTPMMDGLSEEAQASLGAQVPFPARLGRPDEYAELVLAIVRNAYLNGTTIRLDGALRMAPK